MIVGRERKRVTVCDESFGGIGVTLALTDAMHLQVGHQVAIVYYGSPLAGQVRWIQRNQEAQQIHLGIGWCS